MAADGFMPATILVVDNETVVLDLVTNILKGDGYTIITAQNGDEAVKIAGPHLGNIDLVLTDIIMPGMSGGELMSRLRVLKPELRVLYMSGYTKYTVDNHGILESVKSFIWKPFSPAELRLKVREVLDSPASAA